MRKTIARNIQQILVEIACKSIGRSIPAGMYEREVPDVLVEYVKERLKSED